jgi:hypothetical protein
MANAATAWDDEAVWAESGFLSFLEQHHVNYKDLMNSSRNGESLRFFRCRAAEPQSCASFLSAN